MMKKPFLRMLALLIPIALSTSAAPALALAPAPTLPTGSKLFAVDCNSDPFQIWDIDVATGDSTPVGTPTQPTSSSCGSSGAVNPVDGTLYFIAWHFSGNTLVSLDPETGISSSVAPISGDTATGQGLAIDAAGNAYTSYSSNLYSLDLTTGTTSLIGDTTLQNRNAFAYNPVDGEIYWFTTQGPQSSNVYTIDPTNASASLVSPALDLSALAGYNPDGVNFDSNGIAWVQDDTCNGPGGSCGIEAVNVATGEVWAPVYQNDVTLTVVPTGFGGKGYFYTMGLIFVPGPAAPPTPPTPTAPESPQLADTGLNVGLLLGAGTVMTFAGIFIASNPRRRRA